jgi:2'-5' RNA ligase
LPASALQPELDRLRHAIGQEGRARLHPDHFLHIMVQEIGFVTRKPAKQDELSIERFEELSAAFASALHDLSAFEISIANANSFEDAAFLEVHDGGNCEAIHSRLREVAAVPLIPRYAYLPHVTISHYLGVYDSLETVKALQQFRRTQFGSFPVSEVEIVTMRVDIDYPPIHTSRKIELRT